MEEPMKRLLLFLFASILFACTPASGNQPAASDMPPECMAMVPENHEVMLAGTWGDGSIRQSSAVAISHDGQFCYGSETMNVQGYGELPVIYPLNPERRSLTSTGDDDWVDVRELHLCSASETYTVGEDPLVLYDLVLSVSDNSLKIEYNTDDTTPPVYDGVHQILQQGNVSAWPISMDQDNSDQKWFTYCGDGKVTVE